MSVQTRDIVVVGGGITGLCAAFRIRESGGTGVRLRLLEAAERLGGQIQTERQGPFLLEGGPDSIVTHKPAGIDLCRRLGLEVVRVVYAAYRSAVSGREEAILS